MGRLITGQTRKRAHCPITMTGLEIAQLSEFKSAHGASIHTDRVHTGISKRLARVALHDEIFALGVLRAP